MSDDNGLTEAERRALIWLQDENIVQRNIRPKPDGSREVISENDSSGGHTDLIGLLKNFSKPLHPEIRGALADALDSFGNSILQIKKRARRGAGRPRKDSIADDVRLAYDVLAIPDEIEREAKKLRIPAAGEKPKKRPRKEIISKIGKKNDMSRTAIYETMKAAKSMKIKKK
jgi:hypothetical protein